MNKTIKNVINSAKGIVAQIPTSPQNIGRIFIPVKTKIKPLNNETNILS